MGYARNKRSIALNLHRDKARKGSTVTVWRP
jgi:hypothetical protein